MPPRAKRSTAWRRRNGSATPPEWVLSELARRRLDDLKACRRAWDHAGDPFALGVAVTKADLPEWLSDALLFLIMGEGIYRDLWTAKRRHVNDAVRAAKVARARVRPDVKWEEAYSAVVEEFAEMPDADRGELGGHVGARTMKASYFRVARRLSENPGLYYRAPGLATAYARSLARLESRTHKRRAGKPTPALK